MNRVMPTPPVGSDLSQVVINVIDGPENDPGGLVGAAAGFGKLHAKVSVAKQSALVQARVPCIGCRLIHQLSAGDALLAVDRSPGRVER